MAEQDKQAREKIDARNGLEVRSVALCRAACADRSVSFLQNYAYQVKNAINDEEKVGSKVSAEDKAKVNKAVEEAVNWLEETGAEATTEDLTEKRKALEKVVNPIMEALYKAGGGPEGAGGAGGAGGDKEDLDTEDL